MSWLYHCQDDHELQLTMTKGLSKTLRTEFEAYCSSASTHGLGYFFKFSLLERVFWVLATSVMLILGCLLIHQLWQDWEENPTLLKTDTRYDHLITQPLSFMIIYVSIQPSTD